MTKKEIVRAISEELGLTQLRTKEIVQKTFDAIVETLVSDGRIELRNFGVFEVKKRAARKARNPRTNGQVEVPEKFVVTFKPGKEMEERVRTMVAPSETGQSVEHSATVTPQTAGNPPAEKYASGPDQRPDGSSASGQPHFASHPGTGETI